MNCEKCHVGHYRQVSAPYLRWFGSQIMVIPDSPAYACDLCDDLVYDINFVNKLESLIEQLVDEVQVDQPLLHQRMAEEFVSWQSHRRSR